MADARLRVCAKIRIDHHKTIKTRSSYPMQTKVLNPFREFRNVTSPQSSRRRQRIHHKTRMVNDHNCKSS